MFVLCFSAMRATFSSIFLLMIDEKENLNFNAQSKKYKDRRTGLASGREAQFSYRRLLVMHIEQQELQDLAECWRGSGLLG